MTRCERIAVMFILLLGLSVSLSSCEPAIVKPLTAEQKVEDFQYLFAAIKDSYPYVALKARTDGYDWVAHEQEFLEIVRKTANNEEFAKAISRMLMLLNNGHTGISPGGQNRAYEQMGSGPWKDEVDETTPEKADYWAGLGGTTYSTASLKGTEPFVAVYSAGDYVVVDVSPDTRLQGKVAPGSRVISLDGKPVNEYVKAQYGETWLKYDPLRKINYQRYLIFKSGVSKVAFAGADGKVTEVDVPTPVEQWRMTYSWPPS